jgi:hypothetical protein
MRDINSQVSLGVLDGVELIRRTACGERDRGWETAGNFVEEVHRRCHGIGDRRVQRLAD